MAKVKRKITPRKKVVKKTKTKTNSFFRYGFILAFVLAGITIYFLYERKKILPPHEFYNSVPKGYQSVGLDISHHQGTIDWDLLFNKSGYDTIISFVYSKATEGTTHIDTKWEENRNSLNELGIMNGAYHFMNTKTPALPQAENFLKTWTPRDIDLPPMLDVETEAESDQVLIENMKIWLNHVEKITGRRPIIYTSLNFYETKFQHEFLNYKFWIAAYSRDLQIHEDSRIIHWQYTENGRIPGIRHSVDLNVSKIRF